MGGKRALQGAGGLVHGGGERADALGAEFGGGQFQLLLALRDGFVGGHERVARDLLQGRGGQAAERVSIRRVERLRGGDLLRLLLARALACCRVHAAAGERRDTEAACDPAHAVTVA